MMKCSTDECLGIKHVLPASQDDDEPIILIIKTASALTAIHQQFGLSRADNNMKMSNMRNIFPSQSSGTLEVPCVYPSSHNENAAILYENGRHRTWRMNELGFKTLPVCTMKRFAFYLKEHWAYTEDALAEYDFSPCTFDIYGASKTSGIYQISYKHTSTSSPMEPEPFSEPVITYSIDEDSLRTSVAIFLSRKRPNITPSDLYNQILRNIDIFFISCRNFSKAQRVYKDITCLPYLEGDVCYIICVAEPPFGIDI